MTSTGLLHSDISGSTPFPAHRSFSQVYASFIAYRYQGIHQQPLTAWSHELLIAVCHPKTTPRFTAKFATEPSFSFELWFFRQFFLKLLFSSANFHQWIVSNQSFYWLTLPLFILVASFDLLCWLYSTFKIAIVLLYMGEYAVTWTWTGDLDIISVAL